MKLVHRTLLGASLLTLSLALAACSGLGSKSSGNPGGGGGGGNGAGTFTIGGTVTGLTGTGLVLQDNGGDNLAITASGAFTFKTSIASGSAYVVTVSTQPTGPTQVCKVTNGSGNATANVTTVQVNCSTANLSVGGTVSGLSGTGLVLENNGGDDLAITASGQFTFKTMMVSGATYKVTIKTQPSKPAQNCTVSNASGTITANVTNVLVNCPVPFFNIGGMVVGLLGNGGGMELQNNAGDNLTVTGNGPFTFATPLAFGGAYNVQIFTEPTTQPQICLVAGASGTVLDNVTNIVIDCGHNDWTWITGSNTSDAAGVNNPPPPPGQQNTNTPGARREPATWTDVNGNLWMFSGFGHSWDSTIKIQPLFLDELWEFVGTSDYNCLVPGCLPRSGNGWTLFKTLGVPPARTGTATWTDASGKLWLFGGQDGEGGNVPLGFLNDLWSFDPATTTWTQVGGSGALDTPTSTSPGGRWGADGWVDASGNFWIFGGQGFDSSNTKGALSDLWMYNPGTKVWTLVAGTKLSNQKGSYGSMGTPGGTPGGRQNASSWKDASGNLWLFGGFGLDTAGTLNSSLNDLWKFNTTTKQWTWVAGSKNANQHGIYGNQGVAAAANAPGGRWKAAAWTDHNGNLWLSGGTGLDATGTGLLNDLWVYTLVATPAYPSVNQWTWVKGSNNNSQNGTYGSASVPFFLNTPGARWGSGYWIDNSDQLWMFGGLGFDSTPTSGNGLLNDLWRFLPNP